MSPEETMLNLLCLDEGIVQLSDLRSVDKQFEALSSSERRKVNRKIRKLAKKYISKSFRGRKDTVIESRRKAAGLSESSERSRSKMSNYNKVKIIYVKRLLLERVLEEINPPDNSP